MQSVKDSEIAEVKAPRMHNNTLFCKHKKYKSKKNKTVLIHLKCIKGFSPVVIITILLRRKR